jgi:hypothetical protein
MRRVTAGITHLRCAEHGAESQGGPKRELRLLASVAARDAWLLLATSGRFVEQLHALMDPSGFAQQHGRFRLGQAPAPLRP